MTTKQINTSFYYYLPTFIFGLIALYALQVGGFSFYFLPIFSFVLIPLLELILPQDKNWWMVHKPNFNSWLVVLIVPFHLYIVIAYFQYVATHYLPTSEFVGAIFTVGILCGIYGINVAHELGHRPEKWKQVLAQILLLTSLYMHFIIEHYKGHHKRVATSYDPATARKNESIYAFWIRSIRDSFKSAFFLEKDRLAREGLKWHTLKNKFIQLLIVQFITLLFILFFWGTATLLFFVLSAAIGLLLLETINYVEHYGLLRSELSPSIYEQVNASHSWNSDHILGRYLLFELTRHSHHHENASREYYELKSMEESRQLPTGYPGMILLSLVPPLFFRVMNKKLA